MSAGGQASAISLVIPTYNMAGHLGRLWQSILQSRIIDAVQEVVIVNDGSTDETRSQLDALAATQPKLKPLHLEKNCGRYEARLAGARQARGEKLLFLDTRLEVQPGFAETLAELNCSHESVMGCVDIDVSRSLFCLYWDRSHRAVFWRHYRDTRKPLLLTEKNYDLYLKGTGVLLAPKAVFLQACAEFGADAPLSDDTYLMKRMVARSPILIHPGLRILWVPRENWRGFLARLWERGPSFVEYHVFERQGPFFWVVMAGLLGLLGWAGLLLQNPAWAFQGLGLALGLAVLSTAALARGPIEFVRLAPLHAAVILTFGLAILRGIGVNLKRRGLGARDGA